MVDPEQDVINQIATLSAWTIGTNLFRGDVLADEDYGSIIPRKSVFVRFTGGPAAVAYSGLELSTQDRELNVQVIVRGDPDKYGTTRELAIDIYTALHDCNIVGYYSVRVVEAMPVYVGQDERRSHLFNLNIRLRILE